MKKGDLLPNTKRMQIEVIFFGAIAETTGTDKEVWNLETDNSEEVKALFIKKYGQALDASVRIAVNQEMDFQGPLKEGDVIAFLPPYSGG